ncbi:MFS transporter [Fusobacterium perfoetens]|uniref:MFS transporter n=1 Tax=Fusobacterium perfoetens TaxID=852 RepID=UPI001F40D9E2|nr:MFS transporter [Fusobacterium perfoetens]MCF2626315.1 MFS transporter [Fusobacterium perfoetens]
MTLKNFYIFIIGQFVSQFGSRMTSYGFTLWIYKTTNSVFYTSLVTLCYLVPEILFNFIAGTLSDKWDKKTVLKVSDSFAGVLSFVTLILLIFGKLKFQYIFIINILLGIADSFQAPTSEVVISLIVSKKDYIKTSGIRSFFKSFLDIFVPILSVSIYALWGLKVIIIIDLMTFIFAYLTLIIFVKIPKLQISDKKERFINDFILGIKYLLSMKDILTLIFFMGFINLVYGIYSTALAPMVLLRNGNNDFQLGIVTSMIGIAGLVGSMLLKFFPKFKNYSVLLTNIMIFSFGVCNFSLGIGKNYIIWVLGIFLGNILVPLLLANVDYLTRVRIPIELQGRVFSARNTIQYLFLPVGIFLSGVLNDFIFYPIIKDNYSLMKNLSFLGKNNQELSIALLYIFIGFLGIIGSITFRNSKNFKELDKIDM